MEHCLIGNSKTVDVIAERNRKARQYYHMRVAKDPEFVKYTNDRNRNLIQKKKLEAGGPKKKIGRPKKLIVEQVEQVSKNRVGRPLKYPKEY